MFVVLAITGALAAIVVPAYRSYVQRAKVSTAVADISTMSMALERYNFQHMSLAPDLAAVGYGDALDPWGHKYYYLPFDDVHGHSGQRKDRNLVPINTKYDLYSAGADGQTRAPLTARVSRDDVILANDGGFIGLASDY
jgi:general secretion pathway protein G